MANPVLTEKVFRGLSASTYSETMTVKGTALKSLVLVFMVLAGASYTWKIFYDTLNPASVNPWMWGGVIGGFITAIIISFKPNLAQYLAPVYAVLQGLFLGAISAMFNEAFAMSAPGIVMNATLLTIITAMVMLLIYRANIIKVDAKFTRIMVIAISTIAFYYFIS
ncbi:MAG: Bax inhibitor-1/YccA family protein, partial [Bacteroidales bacterium]|nr:Bax inhibitor-1/YccA family protein [Bacteroidales bacterium]